VHKGALLRRSRRQQTIAGCWRRPRGPQPRRGVLRVGARPQVGDRQPGGRTFSADSAVACRCPVPTVYPCTAAL